MSDIVLLSITPNAEKLIERATRICYSSENQITENSYATFLPNCIKCGHISILSHAMASFHASNISRACSHEMVRHAHLRYLQRSQRNVNEQNAEFIFPPSFDNYQHEEGIGYILRWYKHMIDKGMKREDARYVLPNACATEMVVSGSLQAWWDFLKLRLQKKAQLEIRTVAKQIYDLLNANCPHIFTKELLEAQPKLKLEI